MRGHGEGIVRSVDLGNRNPHLRFACLKERKQGKMIALGRDDRKGHLSSFCQFARGGSCHSSIFRSNYRKPIALRGGSRRRRLLILGKLCFHGYRMRGHGEGIVRSVDLGNRNPHLRFACLKERKQGKMIALGRDDRKGHLSSFCQFARGGSCHSSIFRSNYRKPIALRGGSRRRRLLILGKLRFHGYRMRGHGEGVVIALFRERDRRSLLPSLIRHDVLKVTLLRRLGGYHHRRRRLEIALYRRH